MKIDGKIADVLVKKYKIDIRKEYKIKLTNAINLFVPERIDLIAKYKYIESLDKGIADNFYRTQYKATIEAFSNGRYYEPGNKNKNSFKAFDDTIKMLFKNIKKDGFDTKESLIPISKNGVIMDGAHRVSILAYLGKKVPTVAIENGDDCYDYKFFRKRMLEDRYLDNMVYEYSKLKDNIYVICLWPTCSRKQQKEISTYLGNMFKVVYEKDVPFSYNGLKNFMSQVYYEQKWIGSLENGYKGVYNKVNLCYKSKRPTHIVVIEEKDTNKIVNEKAIIRKKIGIGNHSIHSTDDHDETMRMLSLVLNNNSIKFLNNADPYKNKKCTEAIRKRGISDDEAFGIDTMMLLYGLKSKKENTGVDVCKNLYDPNDFFYYEGKKVVSPIYAISNLDEKDERRKRIKRVLSSKGLSQVGRAIKKKTVYVKYNIIVFLQKIGIYSIFKKILKR